MGRKRRLAEIKVTFISPTGKPAGEFILPIARNPRRTLDHKTWERGEAIRKFAWYLARVDQAGVEAAYEALGRFGCISEALQACTRGRNPDSRTLRA